MGFWSWLRGRSGEEEFLLPMERLEKEKRKSARAAQQAPELEAVESEEQSRDLEWLSEKPVAVYSSRSIDGLGVDASGQHLLAFHDFGATWIALGSGQRIEHESQDIYSGEIARGSSRYVYGGEGRRVYLAEAGRVIAASEPFDGEIERVRFIGDERIVAVDNQLEIRLLSGRKLERLLQLRVSEDGDFVEGLAVDRAGETIYVLIDQFLTALDAGNLHERYRIELEEPGRGLDISMDGTKLVTVLGGARVVLLDAATGKILKHAEIQQKDGVNFPGAPPGGVSWTPQVALSPDGMTLAVSTCVGTLQIWELASLRLREEVERQEGAAWIESLVFFPSGDLAVGTGDGLCALWSLEPLEQIQLFKWTESG